MIATLAVGCPKQSRAKNVQQENNVCDTTNIYHNVNQLSHLTLKDFLNIPSIDDITEIAFYDIDFEFSSPYSDINPSGDKFYDLIQGDTVNIAESPHLFFKSKVDIERFMNAIYECPYIGDNKYRMPEMRCEIIMGVRRDYFLVYKLGMMDGLIIIFLKHGQPIVISQFAYDLNIDGHLFSTGSEHDNPPSDFQIIRHEVLDRRTHWIFY